MSDYVSQYDMLYGLKPDDFAIQNASAHPGGGTEVVEIASGEGLVEDQFEAHLRGMEVAYREPTAQVLAALANDLDNVGFSKLASAVDSTLEKFVVIAEDAEFVNRMREKAEELSGIMMEVQRKWHQQKGGDYKSYSDARSLVEKISGTLLSQDALDIQDWNDIHTYASLLLPERNRELWDGSMMSPGLRNFNWPEGGQGRFVKLLHDMIREIGPVLRAAKEEEQGKEEEVPADPEERQRASQQEVRSDRIYNTVAKVDARIKDADAVYTAYMSSIIDAKQKAEFSRKANSIYKKHLPQLQWYSKSREGILNAASSGLSMEASNAYMTALSNVYGAIDDIIMELEQASGGSPEVWESEGGE